MKNALIWTEKSAKIGERLKIANFRVSTIKLYEQFKKNEAKRLTHKAGKRNMKWLTHKAWKRNMKRLTHKAGKRNMKRLTRMA